MCPIHVPGQNPIHVPRQNPIHVPRQDCFCFLSGVAGVETASVSCQGVAGAETSVSCRGVGGAETASVSCLEWLGLRLLFLVGSGWG